MKILTQFCFALWFTLSAVSPALAAEITSFFGSYSGTASIEDGDSTFERDMSAQIGATKKGFYVSWTSVTRRSDGRTKTKAYTIEFGPSDRDNIYASAMKTNVFGKQVPLDPLKGEPFVWARLDGDDLTVFSLFIDENGDYEMQEYHRSLAEGGLELEFRRIRNGVEQRTVETFLTKE